MRPRSLIALLIATLLLGICPRVSAQADAVTYPARTIRLIVPFSPGAGSDAVARLVAQKLSQSLPASVIVENLPGAGGAIGAREAAKAPADGYTLLFVASPFTTVAAASKNAGYDPLRQFTPVVPIAAGPLAFVINPGVKANTMREFVALARAQPGRLNYGSAGPGSVNSLALELLKLRTGTDIVNIPYKGIAPATQDLLAGRIQAITASIPAALPYRAAGRLRVLAVTGPNRSPLLPDVPTWRESGIENADVSNYWGIVAPMGTPPQIVARLNAEVIKVLAQPDVRARLEREGTELIPGSPENFGALIAADLQRWQKLIAEGGLPLE